MFIPDLLSQSGPKNFGWVPPSARTEEQKEFNFDALSNMPSFSIRGGDYQAKENDQSQIWECVRKLNNGKNLKCLYQQVGSCVGHGLTNAIWYLSYVQCVISGKREVPNLPYEPYCYAQSRVCAGISGYSDGSTGTGAAEAAKRYGTLDSRISDLPKFDVGEDTITFSGSVDKEWGNRGAPSKWIPEGQKHLVKTVAQIRSIGEARQALLNNYPLTIASDWGGMMDPPLKGTPQVRLNSRVDTWMHQMMISNIWIHPSLGDIYYIQNSWSASTHGRGPNNEPLGGFWVLAKELEYIIRQGETFAFSEYDGFPSKRIDEALLMGIS